MEVHLAVADDQDRELVYPCGVWFVPPPGRYKVWLEGNGRISPATSVFSYSGAGNQSPGRPTARQVVAAGTVRLAPGRELASGTSLRLLHTESHARGPEQRSEMSRRVHGEQASEGVLMPLGPILAGVFDNTAQEFLALSPPADVRADRVLDLDPQPPQAPLTDLVVVLELPARGEDVGELELTVRSSEGPAQAPALAVVTADRVVAVWYGLEARDVRLEASSPATFLEPQDLRLRPGRVESHRGELKRRPSLAVELRLPEGLALAADARLRVSTSPERMPVLERALADGEASYHLANLPPRLVEVALDFPPWYFGQRVDLGDGLDQSIVLAPPAHRVSGRVFRGEEPAPARVTFDTMRGQKYQATFETDDEGFYEGVLYKTGIFVALVTLRGSAEQPFMEWLPNAIREDSTVDFHLPANRFAVRVVDADTGAGIDAVRVVVGNDTADGRSTQRVQTDAEGRSALPPLKAGTASVRAESEGYLPAAEQTFEVRSEDAGRELVIALERVERAATLELRLASGGPAADAELVVVSSLDAGLPLWRGQADGEGRIAVPEDVGGAFLLVRHPAAASAVLPLPISGSGSRMQTLAAPAAPLVLRLERPWGEPAARARVALAVEGRWLRGAPLQWLTASGPVAADGVWIARGLPPVPVRVRAWLDAPDEMSWEATSVEIPFPWDGVVEVTTAD